MPGAPDTRITRDRSANWGWFACTNGSPASAATPAAAVRPRQTAASRGAAGDAPLVGGARAGRQRREARRGRTARARVGAAARPRSHRHHEDGEGRGDGDRDHHGDQDAEEERQGHRPQERGGQAGGDQQRDDANQGRHAGPSERAAQLTACRRDAALDAGDPVLVSIDRAGGVRPAPGHDRLRGARRLGDDEAEREQQAEGDERVERVAEQRDKRGRGDE
jgi:hypothetical protein